MAITFTQYLRPTGRPVDALVDRPAAIERLATRCQAAGARFAAEVLLTGDVSLTAERDPCSLCLDDPASLTDCPRCGGSGVEGLAHEIVPNGPAVPDAVDRLVQTAARALHLEDQP